MTGDDGSPADVAEDDQLSAEVRELLAIAQTALSANMVAEPWEAAAQQLADRLSEFDSDTLRALLLRACTAHAAYVIEHQLTSSQ